jgi:hypothetical protein
MSALCEHDQLCRMNSRNNDLLGVALFELYFLGNVWVDLTIYQAVYVGSDSIVQKMLKLGLVFISACVIFFILVATFCSTFLSTAAHSSYPRINSIIVQRKKLSLREKWKLINLIERLAGPGIAVRCLHLFKLNSFNFYQFIILMFNYNPW